MERNGDGRVLVLMFLFALWLLAFGYSFVAYTTTEATGDGFVRGVNRVGAFFGWQGVAGLLAIAIWGVGRRWPKGSPVRRMSLIPIGLALLLVAGVVGVIVWARFQ
ncbi:MAG: hypothetical protein AAFQ79_03285 [Pseudomonadota bacterium]